MLLHGSGPGTTAAAWSSLAAAFAGTFRVIAPDFAGFGASEPWRAQSRGGATGAAPADDAVRPYGRAAWTAQILGLADALGLERFAVVGNSMGGAIALSVAAARPEAVTKVVGIGTLGIDMPLPAGLDQLWSYTPGRENARALLELLHGDHAYVTDAAIEARLSATLEPEPRAAFAEMFPPPRDRWVRDLALGVEELRAIRAPVLLVHGARDRVVPLESSTLVLLGLLRDVRAHVFGGAGHASPVERPAELARLLTTFLGAR
jgi:pimeloyl-ACP methyl ester carboxylesterase